MKDNSQVYSRLEKEPAVTLCNTDCITHNNNLYAPHHTISTHRWFLLRNYYNYWGFFVPFPFFFGQMRTLERTTFVHTHAHKYRNTTPKSSRATKESTVTGNTIIAWTDGLVELVNCIVDDWSTALKPCTFVERSGTLPVSGGSVCSNQAQRLAWLVRL